MNNKGQALVIFVLILPVLIAIGALIIDSAYIVTEKNKLDSINEVTINETLDGEEKAKIIEGIHLNDKNIEIKKYQYENGIVDIHLQNKIDSIFGKVLGINEYEINSKLKGEIKNNKRIISEG